MRRTADWVSVASPEEFKVASHAAQRIADALGVVTFNLEVLKSFTLVVEMEMARRARADAAAGVLPGPDGALVTCRPATMWEAGDEAVVREGWQDAGKKFYVMGPAVFRFQWWVPVFCEDEEDPTFFKDSGLSKVTR